MSVGTAAAGHICSELDRDDEAKLAQQNEPNCRVGGNRRLVNFCQFTVVVQFEILRRKGRWGDYLPLDYFFAGSVTPHDIPVLREVT